MTGAHDMTSLGVLPAVVADREVGEELVRRFVVPLSTLPEDLADSLAATVDRYLAHGRRIDPAARELLIHPNTLRYRIKRYQELVGCDLHEPRCAIEVWWALQRVRLETLPGTPRQAPHMAPVPSAQGDGPRQH
ncbi:helix-turn-helix domain-containing protein [Streptomyces graminilatus]|uniref:PucR family transcriptional regulator n=1 Tax=Streptomyces graminilatus TaxID=1464070 RepID=UPI0006E1F0AC|nr:helix-turn-helix domain-containing protein [Streptomyces graminilatus]